MFIVYKYDPFYQAPGTSHQPPVNTQCPHLQSKS